MDKISARERSLLMKKIRSSNTKFEDKIITGLRKKKVSFTDHPRIFGSPDIIFKMKKVAVFLDSCFWHGCRWHCRMPNSRTDYWVPKIQRNKERDRSVSKKLKKEGWRVIRIWEHQVAKDYNECLEYLKNL